MVDLEALIEANCPLSKGFNMKDCKLLSGDCLELMKDIPDKSIDMVLCDLPFGITRRNKWDKIIPFQPLWSAYDRIVKTNGAIVLFSQMPFGAELICSNLKDFRYEWIYQKPNAVGFLNANRMPLRSHENILVFYKKLPTYNPQKNKGKPYKAKSGNMTTTNYGKFDGNYLTENNDGLRYPTDIIKFNKECGLHPTQKPVALLEYLINTYTNEGETVLDNCMGSGSTGVACLNTNRKFIGMEIDETYFQIAKERIEGREMRYRDDV